jgi:hypothetical protein
MDHFEKSLHFAAFGRELKGEIAMSRRNLAYALMALAMLFGSGSMAQ